MNRLHVLGKTGVFFDLRAQPANVHVDGPFVSVEVKAPHPLEQAFAR